MNRRSFFRFLVAAPAAAVFNKPPSQEYVDRVGMGCFNHDPKSWSELPKLVRDYWRGRIRRGLENA